MGTAFELRTPAVRREAILAAAGTAASSGGLEVVFLPSASVWDGRFANNGWLQELPDPMTKLTWDNAAMVAPTTASSLGVKTGEVVTRDELFNRCWGMDHIPNSRTLDQHISQLRKRIEQDPKHPKIIRTVQGAGYRYEG